MDQTEGGLKKENVFDDGTLDGVGTGVITTENGDRISWNAYDIGLTANGMVIMILLVVLTQRECRHLEESYFSLLTLKT